MKRKLIAAAVATALSAGVGLTGAQQGKLSDDVVKTRAIQYQLLAVHKAMFTEANPIPVKWALHEMGKITAGIRLPLTPLSVVLREPLKAAMKQADLL